MNKSVQNSPVALRKRSEEQAKPRPKSLSDDHINNDNDLFEEHMALLQASTNGSSMHQDSEPLCQMEMEEQTSAIV